MATQEQRKLMAGNRVGRFVIWLLDKYEVPPGGSKTLRLRIPEEAGEYIQENPSEGRKESLASAMRSDPRVQVLEVRQGARTQLIRLSNPGPRVLSLDGDSATPMDNLVDQIKFMAAQEAALETAETRERIAQARELLRQADELLGSE